MAIQAQMYPENLGLPLMGGGGGLASQQDWFFMANNNQTHNPINNMNTTTTTNNLFYNSCGINEFTFNNNLQQQKQQQQQQQLQFQQQQQQQSLLQLQQQYLLQQLQQQQQQRNSCDNNDGFTFISSKNCATTTTATTTASTTTSGSDYQIPMNFSPSFADQLEKQRQEIDRFITLQNERLKLTLQEQRKQQLATVMRKLEEKAMQLMRQKDEEIARENKRTIELEEIIRKMEIENQEWQRLATENEAIAVSLNNTLEQIKEQQQQGYCLTAVSSSSSCSNGYEDAAESCCNFNNNNNEDYKKTRETGEKTGVVLCRVCKSRKSCMLLLPCRHLCCCKDCEGFVDVCPVCTSVKKASIEALIS